jgi:uncharacterized protein
MGTLPARNCPQNPVIGFAAQALLQPNAYPHEVRAVRCIETHISWVFLTGLYAYKVKKPVDLGFLDFSTLALRRDACEAELQLNRRLAPELYIDVVPITGQPDNPHVGGSGTAFEYAVRMHEFPQEQQLDRLLDAGKLDARDMDALARRIAEFHDSAPVAGEHLPFGGAGQVAVPVRENFDSLLRHLGASRLESAVRSLRAWSEGQEARLTPFFAARKQSGHIREVHGDLHLANLVRLGPVIVPFDCIEFSEPLRWIDVMSDLAFLLMDLQFRGRADLAYRVLNTYLEHSGDYEGVRVLRYYTVYRALVRAKVALLRAQQQPAQARAASWHRLRAHVDFASDRCETGPPLLTLMHGLSGSGKSRVSEAAMTQVPAVRVRSDVERKRLQGLPALGDTGSGIAAGAYAPQVTEQTYARLLSAVRAILEGGENAIVDASFLRHADRVRFRALADEMGARFRILSCTAADPELRRRIAERRSGGRDASEADLQVLDYQSAHAEPLRPDERAVTRVIDTSKGPDALIVLSS